MLSSFCGGPHHPRVGALWCASFSTQRREGVSGLAVRATACAGRKNGKNRAVSELFRGDDGGTGFVPPGEKALVCDGSGEPLQHLTHNLAAVWFAGQGILFTRVCTRMMQTVGRGGKDPSHG